MPFWKGSKEGDAEHGKGGGRMQRQQGSRAVDPGDANNNDYYRSLDSDAAETALIGKVEERSRNTAAGKDGFRPAVAGERAPLGVDSLGNAFGDDEAPKQPVEGDSVKRPSFKHMANRVRAMQRLANMSRQASDRSLNADSANGHRRAHTLLASIDEKSAGKDDDGDEEPNPFGLRAHKVSTDFENLGDVWGTLGTTLDYDKTPNAPEEIPEPSTAPTVTPESRPLLSEQPSEVQQTTHRITRSNKMKRQWKRVAACLNPVTLFRRFLDWMSRSFLLLAFPCWILAWFLYYDFGNPQLDFLPGTATLSWWANFVGRQLLLLEVARTIQYLVIDCLVYSTRIVTTVLGPWVTIFCLQSRGWPFVVGGWGLLAMLLLHGDNDFQQHWLHFTGIRIYSKANSGSYILMSNTYLHVLLGMVIAGVATSLKRTIVTLYFGRRNFDMYKPKLEEILNDIIVITEVAELAAEADNMDEEQGVEVNKAQVVEANLKKRGMLSEVRWSSVRFKKNDNRSRLDSVEEMSTSSERDAASTEAVPQERLPYEKRMNRSVSSYASSGQMRIKNLLDRWDEPVNKLDKTADSTVNDILKFRKALTYMDLEHPFSMAFGPASTRDELITSAENVYSRLLKLAPGSKLLPYSVLAVLCENEDGTIDREKRRSLRNLYRPDMDDEVTLLAFIQSCDTVYKRLRYFRASVGNSSVIDKVLEGIINTAFFFVLTLMILSLLNLNPWPLLVSMSTLLVTFAFAFGPSAAKAIEGILLIVGRRPFDIGDRIVISDTPGGAVPGVGMSWLVEDITLFSTTLRFGLTNEVATMSNGSIAAARISNCARSKNAIVHVVMKLHIHVHEGRNVDMMREAIENYVVDNSNIWESIVLFRCEEIDTDNEFVMYRLAVRSRHTWQIAARVLNDRAKLHQFVIALAKKMEVSFDSPQPRRVLYYGGSLVHGAVEDYKKNLLRHRNISSRGSADMAHAAREAQTMETAVARDPIADALEQFTGGSVNPSQTSTTELSETAPAEPSATDENSAFLAMIQDTHR